MSFLGFNRKLSSAFFLIAVFLTAQLVWWILFFSHQSEKSVRERKLNLAKSQKLIQKLWKKSSPKRQKTLLTLCQKEFAKIIHCSPPLFKLRREPLDRMRENKKRYLRMLLLEGLFFFSMMLLGLFLLWQGLLAERELKERQQSFMSAVTHELRTPIGTIRLLIDTILSRELEREREKHYLRQIERQLQRLQSLCEKLLAAATLSQPSQTDSTKTPINSSIKNLIQKLPEQPKDVAIKFIPSNEEIFIEIPPFHLELILSNLIDNAIKHNPNRNKTVQIETYKRENSAHIEITDNGPGIPKRELKKLFLPFYRLKRDQKTRGLGLGLYIAKTLCENTGGKITYRPLSPGSKFILSWPEVKSPPLQ